MALFIKSSSQKHLVTSNKIEKTSSLYNDVMKLIGDWCPFFCIMMERSVVIVKLVI